MSAYSSSVFSSALSLWRIAVHYAEKELGLRSEVWDDLVGLFCWVFFWGGWWWYFCGFCGVVLVLFGLFFIFFTKMLHYLLPHFKLHARICECILFCSSKHVITVTLQCLLSNWSILGVWSIFVIFFSFPVGQVCNVNIDSVGFFNSFNKFDLNLNKNLSSDKVSYVIYNML